MGSERGISPCPVLQTYDRAFAERLAEAVAALEPANPLVIALSDYVMLRDQVRACARAFAGP